MTYERTLRGRDSRVVLAEPLADGAVVIGVTSDQANTCLVYIGGPKLRASGAEIKKGRVAVIEPGETWRGRVNEAVCARVAKGERAVLSVVAFAAPELAVEAVAA